MPFTRDQIRCVLSIAGSDSGGGTGLQADLKTFLSHRVHGAVAVTCVTAQDTRGVHAIQRITGEMVRAQILAVLDDLAPEAAKLGFIGSVEAAEAIASVAGRLPPLVIDPVCVNMYGQPIWDAATMAGLRALLPYAALITPNAPEAALLSGRRIESVAEMAEAAVALLATGAGAVLVKGGRLDGEMCPDVLALPGQTIMLEAQRVYTTAVHGTGDTLSSAIASRLAWGLDLPEAVRRAKAYVTICLTQALEIGRGQGPVGHVPAEL